MRHLESFLRLLEHGAEEDMCAFLEEVARKKERLPREH